jgi:hypothetical protein
VTERSATKRSARCASVFDIRCVGTTADEPWKGEEPTSSVSRNDHAGLTCYRTWPELGKQSPGVRGCPWLNAPVVTHVVTQHRLRLARSRPDHVVGPVAVVREPRQDEQQVRQPLEVRGQNLVDSLAAGEGRDVPLGSSTDRPRQVQVRPGPTPAEQDEVAQRRQLSLLLIDSAFQAVDRLPGQARDGRLCSPATWSHQVAAQDEQ